MFTDFTNIDFVNGRNINKLKLAIAEAHGQGELSGRKSAPDLARVPANSFPGG